MTGISGVTYPIPKQYMQRFFREGKTVFVKPATVYRSLKAGMKFLFYQSREDTGFVGEARIKRIFVSENPLQFLDTYGNRIFLSREELIVYMQSQKSWRTDQESPNGRKRPWIALELDGIVPYEKALLPERVVPIGGRYIREGEG